MPAVRHYLVSSITSPSVRLDYGERGRLPGMLMSLSNSISRSHMVLCFMTPLMKRWAQLPARSQTPWVSLVVSYFELYRPICIDHWWPLCTFFPASGVSNRNTCPYNCWNEARGLQLQNNLVQNWCCWHHHENFFSCAQHVSWTLLIFARMGWCWERLHGPHLGLLAGEVDADTDWPAFQSVCDVGSISKYLTDGCLCKMLL